MKALDAIQVINDLAASQRGLFTAAQVQAAGVTRLALARLANHGQIERVGHGVYRAGGAPSTRVEDVLAAWMEFDPSTPTYLRDKGPQGFTASLNTAAWLHGIGVLNPVPLAFSHPKRRQTSKKQLRFLKRELELDDITVVSGIPVTSPRRTVLDLLDYGEDLSLVSGVLADALEAGLIKADAAFANDIQRRAKSYGFDSGISLLEYMRGL